MNVDLALLQCPDVERVLVIRRTGAHWLPHDGRDIAYEPERNKASADCPPEPMGAEDPLFILYTSVRPANPRACCTPRAAT